MESLGCLWFFVLFCMSGIWSLSHKFCIVFLWSGVYRVGYGRAGGLL
jgi:hypothetical protein